MNFRDQLHPSWRQVLYSQLELLDEIENRLRSESYLPPHALVMKALSYDFTKSKVLILGQDPYPDSKYPVGLSFSIPAGVDKFPPTLQNIFREVKEDLGVPTPKSGDLTAWSEQGVVLLNRTLTCRAGESNSHLKIGWRSLTEACVKALADNGVVAILWGANAQELSKYFPTPKLIKSAHPSPLSAYRGFFGSKPFSRANAALVQAGNQPIDWSL